MEDLLVNKKQVALVTGASGFIGKNLCGILIEKGYKVAVVPRDMLYNPDELQEYIEGVSPNYIFHLAAFGNHSDQIEDDLIFIANTFATFNLLNSSRDYPYLGLVNVSTSSVYDKTQNKPLSENDLPIPDGMYAATKLAAEQICTAFAKKHGKPIVNVRPFSVYGPGEADHRFIPTVIDAIENRKVLPLAPEPVHDWIYIEDFIEGLIEAAKNASKGGTYNLGTGIETSNLDVVSMLSNISGKEVHTKEYEKRNYDTNSWRANTAIAKAVLGFEAKTSLKDGLKKTFDWYKNPRDFMEQSLEGLGVFKPISEL